MKHARATIGMRAAETHSPTTLYAAKLHIISFDFAFNSIRLGLQWKIVQTKAQSQRNRWFHRLKRNRRKSSTALRKIEAKHYLSGWLYERSGASRTGMKQNDYHSDLKTMTQRKSQM